MTVGFLINTCEPFYRGGYERRVWAFARQLSRMGHDVRIYTSCPRDEIIDGVHFIPLGPQRTFFNQRGVRNGWADLLFALDTLKLAWKLSPGELDVLDVCATPFLHLPMVALVGWWRRIPIVLTCHEALLASLPAYARERGHSHPVTGGLVTRLLAAIYCFGTGLFSRRLAVSQRTAGALEKEGYPAFATVEFGLEPEAFGIRPPTALPIGEPVRFIFCGRLTGIKNVEQTLTALLALRSEAVPFHFDIVGEGSERNQLQQKVREAGAESLVTFHGEVSEETKRQLLARSEIFILSSPREGFSIATLEAMAQGCGTIVVNDPLHPNGVLDFVRHDREGLVIAPGEPAMRQAISTLLRDAALRLKLRSIAWETARNYQIEPQAKKLLKAYGDVTG